MNECLPEETIKLLSGRNLRGERLVSALRHLEACAICRAKVRMPTREEILKRLVPDDQGQPPAASSRSSDTSSEPNPTASSDEKDREEEFKNLLDRMRGEKS